jgi:hypothetical protein
VNSGRCLLLHPVLGEDRGCENSGIWVQGIGFRDKGEGNRLIRALSLSRSLRYSRALSSISSTLICCLLLIISTSNSWTGLEYLEVGRIGCLGFGTNLYSRIELRLNSGKRALYHMEGWGSWVFGTGVEGQRFDYGFWVEDERWHLYSGSHIFSSSSHGKPQNLNPKLFAPVLWQPHLLLLRLP